ncbi:hypothetical protein BS78_09G247600 [Paspalum vaginatum]|nr:hypothetical protein BS78_09G247600 [Paspalum vaginatum]
MFMPSIVSARPSERRKWLCWDQPAPASSRAFVWAGEHCVARKHPSQRIHFKAPYSICFFCFVTFVHEHITVLIPWDFPLSPPFRENWLEEGIIFKNQDTGARHLPGRLTCTRTILSC